VNYIEKAGSGILDMIKLCDEAGLAPVEFRQEGGQSIQRLWRPTTLQVTPEVTPEAALEVIPEFRLVQALQGDMSRQELQWALGLRDEKHFRTAYLRAALTLGLIERTIPESPRSGSQQYRLTPIGEAQVRALRRRNS
jgi:ATP-dependent DNA helicase RecG